MKLDIQTLSQEHSEKKLNLSDEIFNCEFNEPLIHQVVVAYLAGGRSGTKAQKTRSEVRGGGKKPWKQKHTGRARAGSIRSPLWRGGGKTFAATPRSYVQKVNKKMYRSALCSILSELIRQKRLHIFEHFQLGSAKTKELKSILDKLQLNNVLMVMHEVDQNLYLSSRNIPDVNIIDVDSVDPVALIQAEQVVMTAEAVRQLEEKLT